MFEAIKNFWKKPETEEVDLRPPSVPADYWKLEQFLFCPLFVFDELMEKGKHHDQFIKEYAHNPEPIHPSVYTSEKFHFFYKDLGDGHSYPYALPETFKPDGYLRGEQPPAKIRGELWFVRPQAFISLDIHKDVGVQFNRKRIRITYPTTPIAWSEGRPIPKILPDEVRTIEAWTYIGIPEYWRDQIGGIFQNQMQLYDAIPKKAWLNEFYKNDL